MGFWFCWQIPAPQECNSYDNYVVNLVVFRIFTVRTKKVKDLLRSTSVINTKSCNYHIIHYQRHKNKILIEMS